MPFPLAPSAWLLCFFLPLLSITTVSPPSKLGASTLPMSEDSAPLLAHTRTKGQEQWNTHPLTSSPQRGQGNPRLSGGLVPPSSLGTEARAKVVGIMASRAEPRAGNQESWAPSGCPSPAKD